ncbi:MAG: hypothetical protein ACOX6P_08825 [Candidatus Merdivicinus sp.]|jgi:hypothetical protein
MLCKRFENAPLITPESHPSVEDNINGPTLLRVPDFVPNPLGKYYLYFANHRGKFIRLAFSDSPEGPFTVYAPGVFHLEEIEGISGFHGHIASPDIWVDSEQKKIYMFFHGLYEGCKRQQSGIAVSEDGIHFTLARPDAIPTFYMRIFEWDHKYYAFSKNVNISGLLSVSDTLTGNYETVGELIPKMRHCALWKEGNELYLFYTVVEDNPERILCSKLILTPNMTQVPPVEKTIIVAEPETNQEGLQFEALPSKFGPQINVRQLRDPFVYEENGVFYLYFSYAGENGISGGILDMDEIRHLLA